jgi:hypothetical protein
VIGGFYGIFFAKKFIKTPTTRFEYYNIMEQCATCVAI